MNLHSRHKPYYCKQLAEGIEGQQVLIKFNKKAKNFFEILICETLSIKRLLLTDYSLLIA